MTISATRSRARRYDAFISYSHAADGKLAPALQSGLHRLAKPWYKLRAMRVFRDETDLSATPEAWPTIGAALEGSEYFLLLASPEAARSKWVRKEVQQWLEAGRAGKLLLVLTDGEIVWDDRAGDFDWQQTTALPEVLSKAFETEPLWVDLRWARQESHLSRRNPDFVKAVARLAAPIRNLQIDTLIGQDHREHRRTIRLVWSAVALLAVLTAFAFSMFLNARAERNEALRQEGVAIGERDRADKERDEAQRQMRIAVARRLAVQANSIGERYPQRRVLLAVEAIKATARDGHRMPAAEQALRDALAICSGYGLCGHEGWISAVAISPDNRWLATGSADNTARLWDLTAEDPSKTAIVLQGHEGMIWAVAISPDNRWLVTGGEDPTARLWDLTAEDPSKTAIVLQGHEGMIWAVAISADSHWLVTGSFDKTARLWDLTAEDPSGTDIELRGHKDTIWAVAISADSHWLVTGSRDNTARLWDLTAEDPSETSIVLRGHDERILAVAISPDNRWLVTGSLDNTARLWDLTAEDPSQTAIVLQGHEVLRGHDSSILAVAISPDNRWLVTGSYDKTARLWALRVEELLDRARRAAGRNLSLREWEQYFPGEAYRETFPDLPPGR